MPEVEDPDGTQAEVQVVQVIQQGAPLHPKEEADAMTVHELKRLLRVAGKCASGSLKSQLVERVCACVATDFVVS